ncbi:ADP-ribosyltransferase [Sphingomonas bacterium]|uniref:ADP-ribosyltransferase n=1 Tax=Sphingomonas bacterium TaxID=1895847 RepID=UPI002635F9A3|nr:ADP-ribosyltransferase [Sphingomonas bacterium]MDB5679005.1 hypothetical protein [Sphingomonas bacterium]
MTDEEAETVRDYSGAAYHSINAALRGDESETPKLRTQIALIDSALAKSMTSSDLILFRGVDGDAAALLIASGLRAGAILRDPAFVSTSLSRTVALRFAAFPPGGLMYQITVPAGSIALDATPYSQYATEQEYILPRDCAMRVIGVNAATRTIELELV